MASVADTSGKVLDRAAVPPLPVCRLGADQYEEMIRAGIITEDDPIELLDGWLVPKMTKNPPHILVQELVRDALHESLPAGWCVYSEQPVRLPASMPEPDAMVIRGDRRQFRDRRLCAADVGLIVEVADASLSRDLTFKKGLYAQAGIPIYWLVNLIEGRIEEYTEPSPNAAAPDYRLRRDYIPTDEIPLTLDGHRIASIPVRNLLP